MWHRYAGARARYLIFCWRARRIGGCSKTLAKNALRAATAFPEKDMSTSQQAANAHGTQQKFAHKKIARRGAGDAPSGRSSSGWLGQREVFVEKATTHLVRQVRSCRHPILDYPVLPQSHVTLPFVQRQEMVV